MQIDSQFCSEWYTSIPLFKDLANSTFLNEVEGKYGGLFRAITYIR